MRKRIGIGFLFLVLLCGCKQYDRVDMTATTPAPVVVRPGKDEESQEERADYLPHEYAYGTGNRSGEGIYS